jgi:hypothetical protein
VISSLIIKSTQCLLCYCLICSVLHLSATTCRRLVGNSRNLCKSVKLRKLPRPMQQYCHAVQSTGNICNLLWMLISIVGAEAIQVCVFRCSFHCSVVSVEHQIVRRVSLHATCLLPDSNLELITIQGMRHFVLLGTSNGSLKILYSVAIEHTSLSLCTD